MAQRELVLFVFGAEIMLGEAEPELAHAGAPARDYVMILRPAVLKLFMGTSQVAGAGMVGSWVAIPFPVGELIFALDEAPPMFPAPELEAMHRAAFGGAAGRSIVWPDRG